MVGEIDVNADQIDDGAQVIGDVVSAPVDFDQLGHAGPPRRDRPRHDFDHLIGLDRREPGDRRLFYMELHRLAICLLSQL